MARKGKDISERRDYSRFGDEEEEPKLYWRLEDVEQKIPPVPFFGSWKLTAAIFAALLGLFILSYPDTFF
jgi:hypothetical protein